MLVMGQTDRIGSQFLDDLCVFVMIFPGQGISFIQTVLVTAYAAKGRLGSVEDKSSVGIAGETAHAGLYCNLVISFISSLQRSCNGIKVRVIDSPQPGIRNIQTHCRGICRTASACHFIPLCIQYGIKDGKILIWICHVAVQLKNCSAPVTGLRRYRHSRSSEIIQVKMGVGNADQVYAAVKSSVEGKVRRLGIYAVLVLIGTIDHQKIVCIRPAEIRYISPENGITAFMVNGFFSIDVNSGLLSCRQDFHIDPSSGQRLFRSSKGFGIPAASPVIASVSVMSVHRIPCVRQIHILPVCRQGSRKARIFLDEFPSFVQIDDVSHSTPPVSFSEPFTS